MQKEDALNYEKTLERIAGIGLAPVAIEISLASIASTMLGIYVELQRMNVTNSDNANRISAIVQQMQASSNQIQSALNGNTSMVASALSRTTQVLEELRNANRSGT